MMEGQGEVGGAQVPCNACRVGLTASAYAPHAVAVRARIDKIAEIPTQRIDDKGQDARAARHEPGVEPLFYGDLQLRDRMIQLRDVGRMIVVQKLLRYGVEDGAKLGCDFAEQELEIPPVHVTLRRSA